MYSIELNAIRKLAENHIIEFRNLKQIHNGQKLVLGFRKDKILNNLLKQKQRSEKEQLKKAFRDELNQWTIDFMEKYGCVSLSKSFDETFVTLHLNRQELKFSDSPENEIEIKIPRIFF